MEKKEKTRWEMYTKWNNQPRIRTKQAEKAKHKEKNVDSIYSERETMHMRTTRKKVGG